MKLLGTSASTSDQLGTCAETSFTGCMYVVNKELNRTGRIYFTDGKIYAAQVDGFLPRIARRLRTAGVLTNETYASVVAAHEGDDTDPGLGKTCLALNYTDQDTLDALNLEFVLSAIAAIFTWGQDSKTKVRKNVSTDLFVIKPREVTKISNAVLKRAKYRGGLWNQMSADPVVGDAIPVRLFPHVPTAEEPTPDLQNFFNTIDGIRNLDEIAGELGLTRFETVFMLHMLTTEGSVTVKASNTSDSQRSQPS